MALQGQVRIQGGGEYGIVECEYEFSQAVDDTGKPTTRTMGGAIRFVMPATCDDDQFFYKWMFNKTAVYSGTFRFCVVEAAPRIGGYGVHAAKLIAEEKYGRTVAQIGSKITSTTMTAS